MKRISYIVAFAISSTFIPNTSFAQQGGVSINATGTTADPSAMLDVTSTSKGVLVSRMDSAQRVAISSPAIGLLVYQTDGITPGFYNYNGSVWQKVGATIQPQIQIFSTPGSYSFTTSSNITTSTMFKITIIGGGAGGGAAQFSNYGGGGGAGANVVYYTPGLTPNTTYQLIVGAGGAASTNGAYSGIFGVNSGYIICGGGYGGEDYAGGGGGITSISGTIANTILASNGASGSTVVFNTTVGGYGGYSLYGSGGTGATVNGGGGNGGIGCGGGGGSTAINGGTGGNGLIMFEWSE